MYLLSAEHVNYQQNMMLALMQLNYHGKVIGVKIKQYLSDWAWVRLLTTLEIRCIACMILWGNVDKAQVYI